MSDENEELGIKEPPRKPGGILKELGPGLIVAAAVVGSGELIATTATGAQAGFYLLWLIVIGCVIKVFVQVEIGRFAITTGKTSLEGMQMVPGPRIGKVNWVLACWLCMIIATTFQMGGIVGGVGQSMALSIPLTEVGKEYNELMTDKTMLVINSHKNSHDLEKLIALNSPSKEQLAEIAELKKLQAAYAAEKKQYEEVYFKERLAALQAKNHDDVYWSILVCIVTIIMLVKGGYGFISSFVTVLIGCFTLATVLNLIMLQTKAEWAIPMSSIIEGLKFQLPPVIDGSNPLATALATFGIIGVAAGELVFYPYWCLEAGYAKFVGPKDDSQEWANRANGWLNVLRWDAWSSLVVYTLSTIVFYLLGAGILNKIGLLPEKSDMIRTLGMMYQPVFGEWARWIFLFGAFAVLFSTFFVGNASKARVMADSLNVFNLKQRSQESNDWWTKFFCILLPSLCVIIYATFKSPTFLVLLGGLLNALMLPVMAISALYFRYKMSDGRVIPGKAWDAFLWVSAIGLIGSGSYTAYIQISGFFN
ncbi:MAG: Nramp family divalent metal transporter [Lentisphaerales bacterium]|nr:Nramp family divalent metal transporter [Lentisphaerales bacterium]